MSFNLSLASQTPLVLCSEPTSGLDARAASIVMRAVRNTVNTKRTVRRGRRKDGVPYGLASVEGLPAPALLCSLLGACFHAPCLSSGTCLLLFLMSNFLWLCRWSARFTSHPWISSW